MDNELQDIKQQLNNCQMAFTPECTYVITEDLKKCIDKLIDKLINDKRLSA